VVTVQIPRGAINRLRCESGPVEPEPDNAGGGKEKLLKVLTYSPRKSEEI
jgi:hypothetical protein